MMMPFLSSSSPSPDETTVNRSTNTRRKSLVSSLATMVGAIALSAGFSALGAKPAQADGVVVFGGNGGLTVRTPGFGLSIGNPYGGYSHGGTVFYGVPQRFPQTTYSTTTYSVNGGQGTLTIRNPQVVHPYSGFSNVIVVPSHTGTVNQVRSTRVIRSGQPRPVNISPLN
ncbi:MAG: hypothetical protein AAF651_14235 [Cyanobacteria bacterium P01_C01_bin.73]